MIATNVMTIAPLTHREAMALQRTELERTLAAIRSLEGADWTASTDCPDWDVRAMYQHVLGSCESGAFLRENFHQLRRARTHRRQHGGPLEAALSAVQVNERRDLSALQIVERMVAIAPKTVRGRSRTPGVVLKHAKLAVDGPVYEKWNLGYLIDTIYLRDLWMHRVDLSRAVNQTLDLSAEHDGRIVADVVSEWARRHGQSFVLELTGAAGANYASGSDVVGTKGLSMDAVEFCRTLSGRAPASGLLSTVVPF